MMNDKSYELVNELISASIALGRGIEPDWQTRIEKARVALMDYIEELKNKMDSEQLERELHESYVAEMGYIHNVTWKVFIFDGYVGYEYSLIGSNKYSIDDLAKAIIEKLNMNEASKRCVVNLKQAEANDGIH